ncbi:37962_t:CDS:1, partial [Gigaspora margarita]
QMEEVIKVSQRFFKFNDIYINATKSKLLVLNSTLRKEDQYIEIEGHKVMATGKNTLMRFLGVWIGTTANEKLVVKRAKMIVGMFHRTLQFKSLSISQLSYINNMCIVPKLVYMLQITKITKERLEEIYQPIVRLLKNKAELTSILGNYIVLHQGLERCRSLADEVFSKQFISVQNRLNNHSRIGKITRIHMKNGFVLAGLVNETWK